MTSALEMTRNCTSSCSGFTFEACGIFARPIFQNQIREARGERVFGAWTNEERSMEETPQQSWGSVTIESIYRVGLLVEVVEGKELDSPDRQMKLIFNENEINTLLVEVKRKGLIPKSFYPVRVVPRNPQPLSNYLKKLIIEPIFSETFDDHGDLRPLTWLLPNFKKLKINLKSEDPSKIEKEIKVSKLSEGLFETCIDKRVFDAFKIFIVCSDYNKAGEKA